MNVSALIAIQNLLEKGETKGMKLGLNNMLLLNQKFHKPSQSFLSFHVAGTNGKGSVTTKIAHSLMYEGIKVGLYTSPHLSSFQERIQVNGKKITIEDAERILSKILSEAEEMSIKPTFFEFLTMLAFLYFQEQHVEISVLEVGMGGRLDATNIVTPLLSIITSIGWDHTKYLGNTLEQIAFEKAGIIKSTVPVLVGPKAANFSLFKEKALQLGCPYFEILESFDHYENENRAIASRALDIVELKHSKRGLEVTPSCRFEYFYCNVPIVLDVGHNPDALEALFRRYYQEISKEKPVILMAMSSDKEVEASLEICAEGLQKICERKYLLQADAIIDIEDAFKCSLKWATRYHRPLLVCGTFFIMDSIVSLIKEEMGSFSC
jgi:dihydrofolate synthase/folylpolyglutamate synthase